MIICDKCGCKNAPCTFEATGFKFDICLHCLKELKKWLGDISGY